MTPCNICGGSRFLPGPFDRLSMGGQPPRCAVCGSLERHRSIRSAIDDLDVRQHLAGYDFIRFSPDPTFDDAWFLSAETSNYGVSNSLDIQSIDRPDGAYDVVHCSHVLEHVADDAQAIREMLRILSPHGFLVIAVPHSDAGPATVDWGFADPARNMHYRAYGREFDARLQSMVLPARALTLARPDPVTGDSKRVNIITKSADWSARLLALGARQRVDRRAVAESPVPGS